MSDRHPRQHPSEAAGTWERPVLPTGALRRTSLLAALPLRHAARTAAAAGRLSRAASDQVAARTVEQVFATLGELKGGAAKLGQAMSVFEAAMPEEVAAPYRSVPRRLTDAAPALPTVPTREFHLAYCPGFCDSILPGPAQAGAHGPRQRESRYELSVRITHRRAATRQWAGCFQRDVNRTVWAGLAA